MSLSFRKKKVDESAVLSPESYIHLLTLPDPLCDLAVADRRNFLHKEKPGRKWLKRICLAVVCTSVFVAALVAISRTMPSANMVVAKGKYFANTACLRNPDSAECRHLEKMSKLRK